MLAIAILIGLALWVLITLVAIVIGVKIAGLKGAFAGFMLTMGGWFVYWVGEYVYIQHKVTQLCESEGGITVYVTPEEWRKQIGEAEWEKLSYIGDNVPISTREIVRFKSSDYIASVQINARIQSFSKKDNVQDGINTTDLIYVDTKTKKTLYRLQAFYVGTDAIVNSLEGLKFWIDNIKDCPFNNTMPSTELYEQFSNQ